MLDAFRLHFNNLNFIRRHRIFRTVSSPSSSGHSNPSGASGRNRFLRIRIEISPTDFSVAQHGGKEEQRHVRIGSAFRPADVVRVGRRNDADQSGNAASAQTHPADVFERPRLHIRRIEMFDPRPFLLFIQGAADVRAAIASAIVHVLAVDDQAVAGWRWKFRPDGALRFQTMADGIDDVRGSIAGSHPHDFDALVVLDQPESTDNLFRHRKPFRV